MGFENAIKINDEPITHFYLHTLLNPKIVVFNSRVVHPNAVVLVYTQL